MPTSLRLNGDRDRAAIYWGEAKRILFQLKNDLELQGLEHGWRNRSYTDGTTIRVGMIYGADIIEINSPFKPVAVAERWEALPFILCYRSGILYKIYSLKFDDPTFEIAETGKILTNDNFHLVDSDTGTAIGIINKPKRVGDLIVRKDHVIAYGLTYADWLSIHYPGGSTGGGSIDYPWIDSPDYRYIYHDPGVPIQPKIIPVRMVYQFGVSNKWSYYSPKTYFPKKTDDVIEWTVINHNTIGLASDIKGKNNITLDAEKRYATSWGERIREQGNAPYSASYDTGPGGVFTDPWNEPSPEYNFSAYLDMYMWPVVGTMRARNIPKIYALYYQDDTGEHSIENFLTDTLNFVKTYAKAEIDPYNYTIDETLDSTSLSHWILAAIGDKKVLYLKNALTQAGVKAFQVSQTDTSVEMPLEGGGHYHLTFTEAFRSSSESYQEDLTQDFYAGNVLIETLNSGIALGSSYHTHGATFEDGGGERGTGYTPFYEVNDTLGFAATLRWVEVLDYSNHESNFICFYKKITQTIAIDYTESGTGNGQKFDEGGNPVCDILTTERIIEGLRKVEYYVATIIGGVLTKRLITTINITHNASMEQVSIAVWVEGGSYWEMEGDPAYLSATQGVGDRLYGVSCQMNKDYAVFSFNKETFAGTETGDYYKVLGQGYDPPGWTYPYESNWYRSVLASGTSHPMPYPFPLEDMNLILDTATEAWVDGHFCVGAIGIEKHPGVYAYAEFDNQVDVVAATGILDLLRRIE